MSRCYLVCYDIRNSKRLNNVHKVLKGYGEPWQYSVFFCVLKDIDRVRLQFDIEKNINSKEDQALIVDLGSNEEEVRVSTTVIGQALPDIEKKTIVI